MGSLYEPSVRSSTWSVAGKRLSQRFTTLEGWRQMGLGIYTMSSNVRMFSVRHQFNPEHYRTDDLGIPITVPKDIRRMSIQKTISIRIVESQQSSNSAIGRTTRPVYDTQIGLSSLCQQSPKANPEPYHLLSERKKWMCVAIVTAAGILPVFTFNISLASMVTIATTFEMSLQAINLSIMFFLLMQAAAPLLSVPLSDTLGRRPVYLFSFITYLITTMSLSFSVSYPMFLTFRGLQAIGVACLASVGCSVIQDIAPVSERERYFSFYQGFLNATLVISPSVGGLMSNFISFKWMFTLLFALSLAVLASIVLFLPETLRTIAGNGALPLSVIHQPLIWIFGEPAHVNNSLKPGVSPRLTTQRLTQPLKLLQEKDIILSLFFSSIVYAIWIMVTISTASLFKTAFGLNDALIGLSFIPNALGTIAGSALIRSLLQYDFFAATSEYKLANRLPPSVVISKHTLPADFPLEHTRLTRLPGLVILFTISVSIYGFTLMYPALTFLGGWICIPLLLQFLIAVFAHAICGIHQTLISDLWPLDSAAASAAWNLSKSAGGAVGAAVVQIMLVKLDAGPTFLACGLMVLIVVPLPIVQWYWGGRWRRGREDELVRRGAVECGRRRVWYS